jgi:uncharacterized protein (DUF1501 family)
MISIPTFVISAGLIHSKILLSRCYTMKTAATIFNTSGGVLDASSSVEDLLAHVKTLSLLNQRAVSAVVRVASFTTHAAEYKKVNQIVSIFLKIVDHIVILLIVGTTTSA